MEKVKKEGKVVTFYSYKGGVGRTMSMVNVAVLMAKQNKKVLLIDWDLEAPGLHTFFPEKISTEETGLVDFIADSITFSKGNDEFEDHQWHDYFEAEVHKHIHKDMQVNPEINIDIIKAGKFDSDYTHRLNEIDWLGFYQRSPYFFSYFSQYLESQYDYIFIDSRTGLSDTGGICTMLMPQILVLVFALNDQNINGVIDVTKQSLEYRFASSDFRDLNILPLPSRIDDQNSTELQKWIPKYSIEFEKLFKETYLLDECSLLNYFNKAKIPYKPEHAYGEKIPVLTESTKNDFFISYHYNQFCKLILENDPCWEVSSGPIMINFDVVIFWKGKENIEYLPMPNWSWSGNIIDVISIVPMVANKHGYKITESIKFKAFWYESYGWINLNDFELTKEYNDNILILVDTKLDDISIEHFQSIVKNSPITNFKRNN